MPAPRALPANLESLIVRRREMDGRPGSLCQICERLARWRVVTRYDYLDGVQSLVTDLCAEHGWTFLTGLADTVRAGDP